MKKNTEYKKTAGYPAVLVFFERKEFLPKVV